MKVRYFDDTDTLYIEFRADPIAEMRDLDENTTLETWTKPVKSVASPSSTPASVSMSNN